MDRIKRTAAGFTPGDQRIHDAVYGEVGADGGAKPMPVHETYAYWEAMRLRAEEDAARDVTYDYHYQAAMRRRAR